MAPAIKKKKVEKEKDEESGVMRTEVRRKPKAFDFVKVMLKYAFSQIGVIVLCCVYAVGGANIYMSMEVPLEEEAKELKRTVALDIIDAQDFLADSFWNLIHNRYPEKRLNMTAFEVKVEEDLTALVGRIVTACEENNYDGEIDTWDMAWTFPNALLFTVTIMTTVGYGHISPKSSSGQLFTIIYALIGMPLLMMFLGNIGNAFGDGIKYTYSRICCRWCRVKRRTSERLPGQSLRECKKIIDDDIGKEEYMPTDQIGIPIILCVIIILGFLSFGSVVFHFWEGWDFVSAAYFCFITMSTIGFGDMVPTNSFLNYRESMYGKFQMVVTTVYTMLGLACLATVMSLIQEGLTLKAERMKRKMGLGKSAKVRLETITARERVFRDSNGYFVGLDGFDGVDTVQPVSEDGDQDGDEDRPSTARTEVAEPEETDIPGQVEEEMEEEVVEDGMTEDTPAEAEDPAPDDDMAEDPPGDDMNDDM